MSLAPAIDPLIRGVEGKPVERNEWCPIPGCVSKSQQRHHLWAKSYLRGQPLNWVQLPSMSVCANTVDLCVRHHGEVTGGPGGHGGWIKLEPGDVFTYYEASPTYPWRAVGPLKPQPQIIGSNGSPKKTNARIDRAHVHLKPGESCDACGYTRPVKREPLPARKQASWNVKVPADAEIGADVLDEWVEQFAALLGYEEGGKGLTRYHVISVLFAWAMQNKGVLIEDLMEARMR